MKRYINKILVQKEQTTYPEKQLNSSFKTKDRTKFEHQPDILCQVKCSTEKCPDDYVGESARCKIERVKDHDGRDTKSHVSKGTSEKKHVKVTQEDFITIGSYFKNNRFKKRMAETLLIKPEYPSLNVQNQSVKVKLLN